MVLLKNRLLLLFLLILVFSNTLHADVEKKFRVGVYDNLPLINYTDDGKIEGVYADILNYVANSEGWQLQYIYADWEKLLLMLEKGKIDILTAVAYSPERAKKYAFSQVNVFSNWGEVITREDLNIQNLFGLKHKRVAVLKKDIYYTGPGGIKNLLKKLDIESNFVEVNSNEEILELIEDKKADAGVISRLYYLSYKKTEFIPIKKTNIIFNPTDLRFAFNQDAEYTPYLIKTIDSYMHELKQDENSIYFKSIDRYLNYYTSISERIYIPVRSNELIIALLNTILLIFIIVVFEQIKKIAFWKPLILAIICFFVASILSVVEGFFFGRLLNIMEHIFYTFSAIMITLWCFLLFLKGETKC